MSVDGAGALQPTVPLFIGLAIDDEVWDHSSVSNNRDRLLEHAVVERFFTEVMTLADRRNLLSKEHFSVDGALIQAWASHRVSPPRTAAAMTPTAMAAGATRKPTGRASDAATTPTPAPPTPIERLFRTSHNTGAIMAL